MSKRYLIPLALLALAAALFAGCVLPSYQLSWEITGSYQSGDYAVVEYTLDNIGYDDLYDTFIRVNVQTDLGTIYSADTPYLDLSVGQMAYGTVYINIGAGSGYTPGNIWVSAAGWNTEDDGF